MISLSKKSSSATTAHRSPALLQALAFFEDRAQKIARLAELKRKIEEKEREAEGLLADDSGAGVENLATKLADVSSAVRSLRNIEAVGVGRLEEADRDFRRSADAVQRGVLDARSAVLGEIQQLVRERIGSFFGDGGGDDPSAKRQTESLVENIVNQSVMVQTEWLRQTPLRSFGDVGENKDAFLPLLAEFIEELGLCEKRLAAVQQMRAGKIPIDHRMESLSPAVRACKRVDPSYVPPPNFSGLRVDYRNELARHERLCNAAEMQGVARDAVAYQHPQYNPRYAELLALSPKEIAALDANIDAALAREAEMYAANETLKSRGAAPSLAN